jgi:hypothetical protein
VQAQVQAPSPIQATGQASATQLAQGQVGAAQQEKQVQGTLQTVRIDGAPSVTELDFASAPAQAPGDWPWLVRTLGMAGVVGAAGAALVRRRTQRDTRKVHDR